MNLEKNLTELGLTIKESRLYIASIELGRANISDISKKADLNRSTCYSILNSLTNKGLVTAVIQKKKKIYVPAEPESLENLVERKNQILKEILPHLKGICNLPSRKPIMSFYEGETGIINTYFDNLTAKDEILSIAGESTFNEFIIKKFPDYIKQRIKNRIYLKLITPNTETMQQWKTQDIQDFRVTKLVSKEKFPFKVNIDIYNNKVAITSIEKSIGLIIEDSGIADTLRMLFKLTWDLLS